MSRIRRNSLPAPAAGPILVCPFTGKEVEVEFNEHISMYRIVGAFYATKWYGDRRALLYDYSTREGVKPKFEKEVRIRVMDREPLQLGGDPTCDMQGGVDVEKIGELLEDKTK
jgi:hypothetical protein